jgi:hypothetical protein
VWIIFYYIGYRAYITRYKRKGKNMIQITISLKEEDVKKISDRWYEKRDFIYGLCRRYHDRGRNLPSGFNQLYFLREGIMANLREWKKEIEKLEPWDLDLKIDSLMDLLDWQFFKREFQGEGLEALLTMMKVKSTYRKIKE